MFFTMMRNWIGAGIDIEAAAREIDASRLSLTRPPSAFKIGWVTCASALFFAGLGVAAPSAGQQVVSISNAGCEELDKPWACCSGLAEGNCDLKATWTPVKRRHQWIDFCKDFWADIDCSSYRRDEYWLGPEGIGICTAEEVGAGAPLEFVSCTEARAQAGWCRAELGCAGFEDPWKCCLALDTEKSGPDACQSTGSDYIPKPADCRKAFDEEVIDWWRTRAKNGRQKESNLNNPPPPPADDETID